MAEAAASLARWCRNPIVADAVGDVAGFWAAVAAVEEAIGVRT
jgi:hypothetical protein